MSLVKKIFFHPLSLPGLGHQLPGFLSSWHFCYAAGGPGTDPIIPLLILPINLLVSFLPFPYFAASGPQVFTGCHVCVKL